MVEWAPVISAGIGATASTGNSLISNWLGSSSNKKAQSRSYKYWKRSLNDGPLLTRQGLESAGYNPLLALGSVGGQSFSASSTPSFAPVGDMIGSAESGARLANQLLRGIKLENKKKELENKNLESDLDTKQIQRLQMEANESLLRSQTDRSDLAYGRDIADTITNVVGTGASVYSAKAMSDVAKQNADTNARNASVRERKANIKNRGVPLLDTSAKGSKPNLAPALGSSANSAGSVAEKVAKELVLPMSLFLGKRFALPAAVGGAAYSAYGDEKKRKRTGEYYERAYKNNPYFSPLR